MGVVERDNIEEATPKHTAEEQIERLYSTEQQTIQRVDDSFAVLIPEQNQDRGEAEAIMSEASPIEMTRRQLYDEIWEISVSGVAKKYDIQYTWLMKQIKEADIPIPPSGYWAKLSFGKPVIKPELIEPSDAIVSISRFMPPGRKRKASDEIQSVKEDDSSINETKAVSHISDTIVSVIESKSSDTQEPVAPPLIDDTNLDVRHNEPETYEQYGKTYNVYDRETLYKEVWELPVTEVAKRYKVSDVAIHKVCKSLDIPTPPLGYWAKLRAGKAVTIMPLPDSGRAETKTGLRTGNEYEPQVEAETLSHLSQEDRDVILAISRQIIMPDENAKMHHKIITHRKTVIEWKRLHKEREGRNWGGRNAETIPFLADTISEDTLPRVCHIIDALIKTVEPLGCSLTNNLKFIVNGETVTITVSEAKDEVKHVLTKEENMQLLKYEEEKRRYSSTLKPNIRKYDHPYNGRISFSVYNLKSFRDCKSYVIEDRLGDILINLYEAAEMIRKEREAREEAERKRKEEECLREERRKRYNKEVDRTAALTNLAEDYDTACKIRRYVTAVEATGSHDEEALAWVEWAKDKADWYDPTVAKKDEYLGKREHTRDRENKELKRANWWDLE